MAAKRRKKRKRPDLINPGFFLRPLRFFAAHVRTFSKVGPPIPTFLIFHGLISVRVTAPNSP
jgi:hypothetical protein